LADPGGNLNGKGGGQGGGDTINTKDDKLEAILAPLVAGPMQGGTARWDLSL
jgi:hypothetical protein